MTNAPERLPTESTNPEGGLPDIAIKTVLILAIAIFAIFSFGIYAQMTGSAPQETAREYLTGELKDADTAKFRMIRKTSSGAICGEVNAKNSFGAYTGYKRFYAIEGYALLERDGSNIALDALCPEQLSYE